MNIDKILRQIEKVIPKRVYKTFQPIYHFMLAMIGAIVYRLPGRYIHIIAVTGTKGKSTTTEYINAVLVAAGYSTAILSTIRFKIGDSDRPNKYKMTMPGRFFVSKFVREAENAHCDFAIIEMTSEGAKFYRHRGLPIDTLVFTNLTPEHIDSHGSFEKYLMAKLSLARAVERSASGYRRAIKNKSNKSRIIVNADDDHAKNFLIYNVDEKIGYKYSDWNKLEEENKRKIKINLPGEFNKMNALAAITLGKSLNIKDEIIIKGIESVVSVRGRCEEIKVNENIKVIVDYAHTADSLEKLYKTYREKSEILIAVLGGTGGGRDKSKRKIMGALAAQYSAYVIVTDEDPYDEDPKSIMEELARGANSSLTPAFSKRAGIHTMQIIESRRAAINKAISIALSINNTNTQNKNICIMLTGKGTDPYIMRANGEKEVWDDATVVKEEIEYICQSYQR